MSNNLHLQEELVQFVSAKFNWWMFYKPSLASGTKWQSCSDMFAWLLDIGNCYLWNESQYLQTIIRPTTNQLWNRQNYIFFLRQQCRQINPQLTPMHANMIIFHKGNKVKYPCENRSKMYKNNKDWPHYKSHPASGLKIAS